MAKFPRLSWFVLTVILPTACGKSDGEIKNEKLAATYADQGGATPEEAFAGLAAYYKDGKIRGKMIEWIAPEYRAPMVLDLYRSMKLAAVDDKDLVAAFLEVKKKHAIPDFADHTKDMKPEDFTDGDKLKALARKMLKGVDLMALVDDLIPVMKKLGGYPIEYDPRPLRVEAVEIIGPKKNKADGRIVYDDTSRTKVEFVKIGGRWFVLPWE